MTPRRRMVFGSSLAGLLLAASGAAVAATRYPDRVGDLKGGAGPDIVAVTLSHTRTAVAFRVLFAEAPPLRVSTHERWVDMLLIGIDVPPLGRRPVAPGGEWPGANFALGVHGPSRTGQLVRLGKGIPEASRLVARLTIVTRGPALSFSIPRRAIGSPRWFTFVVASARETEREAAGGGFDVAPERGTFRYVLAG